MTLVFADLFDIVFTAVSGCIGLLFRRLCWMCLGLCWVCLRADCWAYGLGAVVLCFGFAFGFGVLVVC